MGESVAVQPCGCRIPALDGFAGLIDPARELLLELDEHGGLRGGYPHASALGRVPVCQAADLAALLPPEVVAAITPRPGAAPFSVELLHLRLRIRVVPRPQGAAVVLRSEDSFWTLFEAAPLPLGLVTGYVPGGDGTTHFNRRFTDVFGYTGAELPTTTHWWNVAYPDPAYRTAIRDEWLSRARRAVADKVPVKPLEATIHCKDGSTREIEFYGTDCGERRLVVFVDLTERNRAARELLEAHAAVRALSELLPVCAWCKRLRDDQGYWQQVDEFISRRTGAKVTHGICPECRTQHFRIPDRSKA